MSLTVDVEKYREFCLQACLHYGLSPQAADDTVRVLLRADRRGTFTHGTLNLLPYLNKVALGSIDAAAKLTVDSEGPSFAVLDGHNGMPTHLACEALRLGMDKARATGCAFVTLHDSGHYGASGSYAAEAAEEGFFCLALSNTLRGMGAPGAKGAVIGNSPLAYAMPAPGRHPICVDMATSNVAGMKIMGIQEAGGTCPEGWITDKEGQPMTKPENRNWVLSPMGGYKGYSIAFMIEILCSVLSGGRIIDLDLWQVPEAVPGVSCCFWLLDVSKLLPPEVLAAQMDTLIQKTEANEPAAGTDRFRVPGDPGWDRLDRTAEQGLTLPDSIEKNARALAEIAGLDLDACAV